MTFKRFSEDAPYMETIITHKEYLAKTRVISPWACVGWQIENTPYDWLHVCYLGTGPGHVASVLKMLQVLGYGYERGETDDMFLRRTTLEMRETCRKLGRSDCNRIRVLGFPSFPKSVCKSIEALLTAKDPFDGELLSTGGVLRTGIEIQGLPCEADDLVGRF